ncbi:MAG: response regulator [Leptospiraceae bacterium]|nr:response regulator [Leptospiraceae bacterium]
MNPADDTDSLVSPLPPSGSRVDTQTHFLLLNNITNELNTPIHGILGFVDLLLADSLTEKQRESLLLIRQASVSLSNLLSQVFEISRLGSGRATSHHSEINLRLLLNEVLGLFLVQFRHHGNQLEIDLHSELPPDCTADELLLKQVLINLISAAMRCYRKASLKLDIAAGQPNSSLIVFRVIAMDKESWQGSNAAQQTALIESNLDVVRQLTNIMGGRLYTDKLADADDLYRLELPLLPGEQDQVNVPEAGRSAIQAHILIAEDNRINQLVLEGLLGSLGCSFAIAVNGREAVAMAAKEQFDLILMDIRMPELDGIEATRSIRSVQGPNQDVPIVAVTADALQEQKEACMQAGMNMYQTKPIGKKEMQSILLQLVAHT